MQLVVYFPDSPESKEVMKRVEHLENTYEVSRSKIFFNAVKDFVSVDRPVIKQGDFRAKKAAGMA